MSDYGKITPYTPKDSLPTGDPDKLVIGAELDAEFDAIATMSTTKEDKSAKGAVSGYAPLNASSIVVAAYLPTTVDYTNVSAAHTVGKSTTKSTLTDGATITIDCSLSNVFEVTLAGNRTMAAPTSPISGQCINIIIRQDATGGRTLSWNSAFTWPAGTVAVLSLAASAVDMVSAQYDATAGKWRAVCTKAFA